MNTILLVIAFAALAALVITWARGFRKPTLFSAVNTLAANVGTTRNARRYRAAAALATRYAFVKAGADDEHVAAIAAASDKPLGVLTDEAAAAEDPVNVELPISNRTLPLVAAEAIATLNVDLYMTAAGKVGLLPAAPGTYWRVARNKTLADAADDPVECELLVPEKVVVIAALSSTNGTAAAAVPAAMTYAAPDAGAINSGDAGTDAVIASLRTQLIALAADVTAIRAADLLAQAEAEKIGDDVRAVAGALDDGSHVAVA